MKNLEFNGCIRPENLNSIQGAKPIPVINGEIKWHLDESVLPAGIDKYQCIQAFEKSFQILQGAFGTIKFVSSGEAKESPIILRFRNGNEPDLPNQFGQNVLAYAFPNHDNFEHASDVFFNLKYKWWDMHKPGFISIKKVCVHETLHALGFEHSNDQRDILFWQYQNNDDIILTEDTLTAIRKFYGIGYDLKLVKDWYLSSKYLTGLPESEHIRLAAMTGLKLDAKNTTAKNIQLFKDYLSTK